MENGDISFSAADNEVSYRAGASRDAETLYWTLPDLFTGDQVRSRNYGVSVAGLISVAEAPANALNL